MGHGSPRGISQPQFGQNSVVLGSDGTASGAAGWTAGGAVGWTVGGVAGWTAGGAAGWYTGGG